MRRRARHGIVLVVVLYVCLVVWGFLAALLLAAWSHHRVALATRQHTVAVRLIADRLAALRTDPASDWPDAGALEEGSVGVCSWSLAVVEREADLLRVRLRAQVAWSTLGREATIFAPP